MSFSRWRVIAIPCAVSAMLSLAGGRLQAANATSHRRCGSDLWPSRRRQAQVTTLLWSTGRLWRRKAPLAALAGGNLRRRSRAKAPDRAQPWRDSHHRVHGTCPGDGKACRARRRGANVSIDLRVRRLRTLARTSSGRCARRCPYGRNSEKTSVTGDSGARLGTSSAKVRRRRTLQVESTRQPNAGAARQPCRRPGTSSVDTVMRIRATAAPGRCFARLRRRRFPPGRAASVPSPPEPPGRPEKRRHLRLPSRDGHRSDHSDGLACRAWPLAASLLTKAWPTRRTGLRNHPPPRKKLMGRP